MLCVPPGVQTCVTQAGGGRSSLRLQDPAVPEAQVRQAQRLGSLGAHLCRLAGLLVPGVSPAGIDQQLDMH